jgi:hypothetical protein
MSCDCDCEQPAVYRSKIQRARKSHACCECGGPITPGDFHEYVFAIWDGDPSGVRTCSPCLQLRAWVAEVADCQPCHSELIDSAAEELRNMTGPRTPEVRQLWWRGARFYALASRRVLAAKEARRLRKAATSPIPQP